MSTYFSKLKKLWKEFDALMPCSGCDCEESKKYVQYFQYQRLLQFLIGLNESYSQSSNQILNMLHIPSINRAYSIIISKESRRSMCQTSLIAEVTEGTALFSGKNIGVPNNDIDLFNGKGHNNSSGSSTGGNPYAGGNNYSGGQSYAGRNKKCYKLNGYPHDFKAKKKFGSGNAVHYAQDLSNGAGNNQVATTTNFAGKGSEGNCSTTPVSAGMASCVVNSKVLAKWIVDSGALSHMNIYSVSLKIFKSDNESEFLNYQVAELLKSKGIVHQSSCIYTPQQNKVVERRHMYILKVATSLRFHAVIPLRFLGECIATVVYIINKMPSAVIQAKSPFEVLLGHAPSLEHMRVWMPWLCYICEEV
ncbi:uncharacterized protein [Nicotiana sylvestris]|uniref:uncharacterized protein n=1 Tax=Nicotiana sylvestris TaxID=4096 RepID=UPI00388CE6B8